MEELEAEKEEENGGPEPNNNLNSIHDPKKTSNEATLNGNGDGQASGEEEEVDENKLVLDVELLTAALKEFHTQREDRDLKNDALMKNNQKKKQKENKSTEKGRNGSREKKMEKLYWGKMTQILTDQKRSVWGALDKSLGEYYQLLVDRQNLIEETGLLN